VVTKSGNTLSFEGEKLGVGLEAAKAKLKEDKELLELIKNKIVNKADELGVIAEAEPE
jgi:transcriptional regulator NrdR family protein